MSGCSKSSSSAGSASLISRGNEYWTGHEEKEEEEEKEEKEEEALKKEEEYTARVDAEGKHLGQTVGQKISGRCQVGLLSPHSCLGSAQPTLLWWDTFLHCTALCLFKCILKLSAR